METTKKMVSLQQKIGERIKIRRQRYKIITTSNTCISLNYWKKKISRTHQLQQWQK